MEIGLVDSIKFEVGVTPRASEYVRISTDKGEMRVEFEQLISNGASFAEALTKHAEGRPDTFHDVGNVRWTFMDIPQRQTSLQLWSLDQEGYLTPGADMPYEYQKFELTVDFLKIVDAYRFMLKQYIAEYEQDDFHKAIPKEVASSELIRTEKLLIK